MDPKQFMKQMFDFNKAAVEKSFSVVSVMQDQMEKMISMGMEQNKFFPETAKNAVNEWFKTYRKSVDEFKTKIDESYKNMEKFFTETVK